MYLKNYVISIAKSLRNIFELHFILTLSLGTLIMIPHSVYAADSKLLIDPFDFHQENSPSDISKLSCGQFHEMLGSGNIKLIPTIIWVHGLVSGMERQSSSI